MPVLPNILAEAVRINQVLGTVGKTDDPHLISLLGHLVTVQLLAEHQKTTGITADPVNQGGALRTALDGMVQAHARVLSDQLPSVILGTGMSSLFLDAMRNGIFALRLCKVTYRSDALEHLIADGIDDSDDPCYPKWAKLQETYLGR